MFLVPVNVYVNNYCLEIGNVEPASCLPLNPWDVSLYNLLMLVYSLVALAIGEISPLDPALGHVDNFLPGVPHLLHFRFHVSPPGVSWPSSFLFPRGFHVRACLVMLD